MFSDVPSHRTVIARHTTPTGEIQLQQRPLVDSTLAFEIVADGVFLMASYNQASERALARQTLDALPASSSGFRLLVGGLGMGFTLQEALSSEYVAAVDVVEISAHIIEWNRTHFAPLNGQALSDPRVTLIQDDLGAVLDTTSQPGARYHAILVDVDNGPSWLARENNARLYTTAALQSWKELLTLGGCLAVWSAQHEPEFLARLRAVFGQAEGISIETPSEKGLVEQFVYLAQK
jgi:spermidine synthase